MMSVCETKAVISDPGNCYRNAGGKAPVSLGIVAVREDPSHPGIVNYRVKSVVAWASGNDEAVGLGTRIGHEQWPPSDCWSVSVAVCWIPAEQALALLPPDEVFYEQYRNGCAMDVQVAIENAFRVGQLGVPGEQVEMFRRAA